MKTVICLDGWVYRGDVEVAGSDVIIRNTTNLSNSAYERSLKDNWKPPAGCTVKANIACVVAIIEGGE